MRRATNVACGDWHELRDFYPRSPCGERPDSIKPSPRSIISIHALLAESDQIFYGVGITINNFYPRSPCGERRYKPASWSGFRDFYPRSPCGERRTHKGTAQCRHEYFYPRSPCGERRINRVKRLLPSWISIHALLAESDSAGPVRNLPKRYFYPRSPCGERLCGFWMALNLL